MKGKELLEFLSNIGAGLCLGIIVDFFAKTTFIFTIIGLIAGLVLALVLKNRKKK